MCKQNLQHKLQIREQIVKLKDTQDRTKGFLKVSAILENICWHARGMLAYLLPYFKRHQAVKR